MQKQKHEYTKLVLHKQELPIPCISYYKALSLPPVGHPPRNPSKIGTPKDESKTFEVTEVPHAGSLASRPKPETPCF